MKRISLIKIFMFLVFLLFNMNIAFGAEPTYYLVNVHEDGTRDNLGKAVTSFRQTEELLKKGRKENKNARMLAVAEDSWTGPIVKSEYALVDVAGYQIFNSADGGGLDTYTNVNGNAYYDAAYLETISDNGVIKYKVKLSGKIGYITKKVDGVAESKESNVVPLSQVKSPSHYEVKNGELLRRYSINILAENSYYAPIAIGIAPSGLKNGKYYSYDGNYFYTSLEALIDDARENVHKRAVNKNNPYYNYYQYLSVRSRTNITADEMNKFLNSKVGNEESKMRNTGAMFIKQGTDYTVNPAILYAIACNESAFGKSNIAKTKNNLFGLKVLDTDTGSGYSYNTVEDCIKDMAKIHISAGYCDVVGDGRYAGTFAGNKDSGINVKYASDPYWGEKIASYYYRLDKSTGFKDYGKYKIGVKEDYTTLNTRKTSNFYHDSVYQMKNKGRNIKNLAVIIDSESTGEPSEGISKWYKIRSETILDENKNTMNLYDKEIYLKRFYNYDNSFLYVHSKYIRPIIYGKGCIHEYEKFRENPTCTKDGYEKEICKKCKHVKNEKILASLGHDFELVKVIKEATCKEEGLVQKKCKRCGEVKEEKTPKTNNHKFVEKIIEATCIAPKTIVKKCSVCGKEEVIKVGNPLGHKFVEKVIDASCTTPKTIVKKCSVCGKEEEVKVGNPLGHNFGEWVIDKKPTELDEGIKHRVCTRCKQVEKEIIPSLKKYEEKDGEIFLQSFGYNIRTNKLDINGYLAIRGMDNKNKTYRIEFLNKKTKEKFYKELEAQKSGYPYEIPNLDGHSIKESWFKDSIDISNIDEGDYEIYIIAIQGDFKTRKILSNYYAKPITKKATHINRGYTFETNYYKRTVPVEMTIRNNGLMSFLNPPTFDDMYNYSRLTEFKDGKLRIRGCSFNVGGDYSKNKKVERKLIFENQETFERKEFDIGYIDNGDYIIRLNIPDGKDKTRAWFDTLIDVKDLPKGIYSIYIRTKTDGVDDSSKINDVFNPNLSNQKLNINNKNYSLRINQDEKYTIELIVK